MGKPGWGHARPSRTESIGVWKRTRGTETSQYPEEEKSTETPLVAASERGSAQTARGVAAQGVFHARGCGIWRDLCEQVRELQNGTLAEPVLENLAIQGDSPVGESVGPTPRRTPEYHGTREILWEAGGTILQG